MRERRRAQRWAEKHVFNPVMRLSLRRGWAPRCFALLETTGWRTGRLRCTPVGGVRDGDLYWLVAEHGAGSAYVRNLSAQPRVRVQLGREWRPGTATCLPEDDPLDRRAWIDKRNGVAGRLDGIVFRAFASTPLTVRIDLDP